MLTKEEIQLEVNHIFESGANDIRVCGLIERITEQAAAENADMKFRIEGDAILLQAANQTIKKERAKVAGYQSEQTGLRQTISDQFGRIMDLEGEKAELLAALQELYDEQNDAPLETRRHEWNRAMARAGELLKKYGNG